MCNWYDHEGTVGRERLRQILDGIEAPPPPLKRGGQVALLVAARRLNGYVLVGGFMEVYNTADLDERIAEGDTIADEDLIRAAFRELDL